MGLSVYQPSAASLTPAQVVEIIEAQQPLAPVRLDVSDLRAASVTMHSSTNGDAYVEQFVTILSAAGGPMTLTLPPTADSERRMLLVLRVDDTPEEVTLAVEGGGYISPPMLAPQTGHLFLCADGAWLPMLSL